MFYAVGGWRTACDGESLGALERHALQGARGRQDGFFSPLRADPQVK
jgi:hypothetical protein